MDKKRREEIIQKISDFLVLEEGIEFAYIHGSFLTESTFNDIDIALYLEDNVLSQIDIVDFEIKKSLKTQEQIGQPIDIKVLNAAPLGFRYQASCGNLLFGHNEELQERFLCTTWREYFDFEPVSKIYLKEVLG